MISLSRGNWGWLVLGFVLLVPVFGFWKAWVGANARHKKPVSAKIAEPVFSNIARPKAGALPAASATAGTPIIQSADQESSSQKDSTAPSIATDQAIASPTLAPAAVTQTSTDMPVDTSENKPKADRDPTLSPDDLLKLDEIERQKKLKGASPAKPHVERRLHLYGIVVTGGIFNAIVNDGRVHTGSVVLGARIRKITANCVYFEFEKQAFKKCIKK